MLQTMDAPQIQQVPAEMKDDLKKLLVLHEGYRMLPYADQFGNATIGIGRNLTGRGVLSDEIDLMYQNDINWLYTQWQQYSWFKDLNAARQIALIDFSFCGWQTVRQFVKMLACLQNADYAGAAKALLSSAYAKQVGKRAVDLANIISSGELL